MGDVSDCHLNQCLQLKIRTKNVQNQTKIGPNLNEKTRPKLDLMGPLPRPLQHKSEQNSDFCHKHARDLPHTRTFRP